MGALSNLYGTHSKQFTTAGAEINAETVNPKANDQDKSGQHAVELVVTSITTTPSDLVIECLSGDEDTVEIASTPFYYGSGVKKIKATATSGIKGNFIYQE